MSSFDSQRRKFLAASLVGGGGLLVAGAWSWSRWIQASLPPATNPVRQRERFLFCAMDRKIPDSYEAHRTRLTPSVPGYLCSFTPSLGETHLIPLPFMGHSVVADPVAPSVVFASTKWGDRAALVETDRQEVLVDSKMPEGRRYFGHSVFHPEGKYLYASAANDRDRKGYIAVLDPRSLKSLGEIDCGGFFPHECRLSADGKTIVVVNMMKASMQEHYHEQNLPLESSVAWIDIASGNVVKTLDLRQDLDRVGFAHCRLSEDGWLVVIGGKRESQRSAVVTVSPSGEETRLKVPKELEKRLQSEALSCDFDEKNGLVLVSVPFQNIVFMWEFRTGRFIGSLEMEVPKGVAFRPEMGGFAVTNASRDSLLVVKGDLGIRSTDYDLQRPDLRFGSHLTRIFV